MDNWAKTALSVYRYLDNIVGAVDNLITKKCVNSGFLRSGRADAFSESNNIIMLINRKTHLINLKIITEQSLLKLSAPDRKLLMLAYVDCLSNKKIAQVLDMSIRSVFRKKNVAIHSFGLHLRALGYTDEKFNTLYGAEKWISSIYSKVANQPESAEYGVFTSNLVSDVVREYNRFPEYYQNYI